MPRSAIRRLGEHAARPAWPDPARTNQYPVATARPLEDALAVHLAEGITEQLQSCAIGITEVERPANLLIRYPSGIKLRFDPFPLLWLHGERQVMQPSEDLLIRIQVQPWKVEEGNGIAVSNIEEKVCRPLVIAILEDVGQGEFQKVLIKLDGPLYIRTEQGNMVHHAGGRRSTRSTGT